MPALARSSPTASAHHRTAVPERSRFGADRGSTWRGSRRDVDWINRLERAAADRRVRLAGSVPSLSGSVDESQEDS